MRTIEKLVFVFLLVFPFRVSSQVMDAYSYWKMENDSVFLSLQSRINEGDSLSPSEQEFVHTYQAKLKTAFEGLPDNEKATYYQSRSTWAKGGLPGKREEKDDNLSDQGDRTAYIQHLLSSGYYGLYYGLALDALLELDGATAAGLPFISAGVSTLVPMLTLDKKDVSTNSFLLASHGKMVGAYHGAAFGLLLVGDNSGEAAQKIIITSALASSIALGRLGFKLGERKDLTQGHAALLRHYGILMPLEGLAIGAAFEADDPRVYSALSLSFGAAGYYLSNQIGKLNYYSRGDVIGMQTFTLLNTFLGFGIMADIEPERGTAMLIPASLGLSGTLLGHSLFKNARLSTQQGRYTFYAASGGMLIGLGLTLMASPEEITPYYVVPYLSGLTSYLLFSRKYKLQNKTRELSEEKENKWDVSITPQNYFYAKKMGRTQALNPSRYAIPPVFTASLRF